MSKKPPLRPKHKIKRILDILFCAAALPFALPLGGVLALFICLDSEGSAFYCQERIGKNGKKFKVFKFRTMIKNAEKELDAFLEANPDYAEEWAGSHKLKNDPRLTRAGHFLRKTSLDELPQILNILLGNMTLVGPRPIVEAETRKYGRFYKEYCEVHPGLTGLWQISGRNNTSYAQRVAYDHYYINNWSLTLDLWILAKTIPAALRGDGAY